MMIGVTAYLLSEPKQGSVEWHKREFLRAQDWGIVDEGIHRFGSQRWMSARRDWKINRMAHHQNALIKFGYLAERSVVLHNRTISDVLSNLTVVTVSLFTNRMVQLDEEFLDLDFQTPDTNVIRLIAIKRDIDTWEQLIRKADVPKPE
jgi:hypothetical protein